MSAVDRFCSVGKGRALRRRALNCRLQFRTFLGSCRRDHLATSRRLPTGISELGAPPARSQRQSKGDAS